MAKKKAQTDKPKQHEALEAMSDVFDQIPKGRFALIFGSASLMEQYLRTGLGAMTLLKEIRQYFLVQPELGGEESPFVQKIDKLIPRDE